MGRRVPRDPAAHWLRRALKGGGRDFLTRWIIDGMIRTGPFGRLVHPVVEGMERHPPEGASARRPLGQLAGPASCAQSSSPRTSASISRAPEIAHEAERILAEGAPTTDEFPDGQLDWPPRPCARTTAGSGTSRSSCAADRDRRLRIHPTTPIASKLADGEVVRVRSRVGAVEAEVRDHRRAHAGVVSLPHGWSDGVETHRRVVAELGAGPTATSWSISA
jgi:hypothetical protein